LFFYELRRVQPADKPSSDTRHTPKRRPSGGLGVSSGRRGTDRRVGGNGATGTCAGASGGPHVGPQRIVPCARSRRGHRGRIEHPARPAAHHCAQPMGEQRHYLPQLSNHLPDAADFGMVNRLRRRTFYRVRKTLTTPKTDIYLKMSDDDRVSWNQLLTLINEMISLGNISVDTPLQIADKNNVLHVFTVQQIKNILTGLGFYYYQLWIQKNSNP